MIILKEEINALTAQVLELAKWKLIIVSALAAVGLGWAQIKPNDNASAFLLLLSGGLVCAYIDLLIYRRLTSLHAVAQYLRHYSGNDSETCELKMYELEIKKLRDAKKGLRFWISEEAAHFSSSLAFSLGLPFLAYLRYPSEFHGLPLGIPIIGVVLVGGLFGSYYFGTRPGLLK